MTDEDDYPPQTRLWDIEDIVDEKILEEIERILR